MADTWRWPARGALLADFAQTEDPYAAGQHRGIDIEAAEGAPVTAAVAGTVRFAGLVGSSGLTVSVRTADGRFDTSYLHLSTTAVRAGETVGPGERIGTAGTSGSPSSPKPHLHFGVRDAGTRRYRDPLDFLPPPPRIHDAPRGVPVAVRGPVRVGPAPQPVRPRPLPWAVREPAAAPAGHGASAPAAPRGAPSAMPTELPGTAPRDAVATASRTAWAIACGSLIAAAALLGAPAGRRRLRTVAGRLAPSSHGR